MGVVPWHTIISPNVHLAMSIFTLLCYFGLFALSYTQLWIIFINRYRFRSFHTAYLCACVCFTAIRIVLACYICTSVVELATLGKSFKFFLLSVPIILNYVLLMILVLFYRQILLRLDVPSFSGSCVKVWQWSTCVALVVISAFVDYMVEIDKLLAENDTQDFLLLAIMGKLIFQNLVFLSSSAYTAYAIYKIAHCDAGRFHQNLTRISRARVLYGAAFITIVNMFRALQGMAALVWRWRRGSASWLLVNLEADLEGLAEDYSVLQFLLFLLLYEVIPTAIVLYIFSVPVQASQYTARLGTFPTKVSALWRSVARCFKKEAEPSVAASSDLFDGASCSHRPVSIPINSAFDPTECSPVFMRGDKQPENQRSYEFGSEMIASGNSRPPGMLESSFFIESISSTCNNSMNEMSYNVHMYPPSSTCSSEPKPIHIPAERIQQLQSNLTANEFNFADYGSTFSNSADLTEAPEQMGQDSFRAAARRFNANGRKISYPSSFLKPWSETDEHSG